MKSGRAYIGISQKMRIKNLRGGVSEVRFRKTQGASGLTTTLAEGLKDHCVFKKLRSTKIGNLLQAPKRISTKAYLKIWAIFVA